MCCSFPCGLRLHIRVGSCSAPGLLCGAERTSGPCYGVSVWGYMPPRKRRPRRGGEREAASRAAFGVPDGEGGEEVADGGYVLVFAQALQYAGHGAVVWADAVLPARVTAALR